MILALLALLSFANASSHAVTTKPCIPEHFIRLLGGSMGVGRELSVKDYSRYSTILILSDGVRADAEFAIGQKLAQTFEAHGTTLKRVTSASDQYERSVTSGILRQVKMSNTERFPFRDNEFDLIVLRQGLCFCKPATGACCAGIRPSKDEVVKFFSEVVRVLDKADPSARALLHGTKAVGGELLALYEAAAQEVALATGTRFTIQYSPHGNFSSILIQPGGWR